MLFFFFNKRPYITNHILTPTSLYTFYFWLNRRIAKALRAAANSRLFFHWTQITSRRPFVSRTLVVVIILLIITFCTSFGSRRIHSLWVDLLGYFCCGLNYSYDRLSSSNKLAGPLAFSFSYVVSSTSCADLNIDMAISSESLAAALNKYIRMSACYTESVPNMRSTPHDVASSALQINKLVFILKLFTLKFLT